MRCCSNLHTQFVFLNFIVKPNAHRNAWCFAIEKEMLLKSAHPMRFFKLYRKTQCSSKCMVFCDRKVDVVQICKPNAFFVLYRKTQYSSKCIVFCDRKVDPMRFFVLYRKTQCSWKYMVFCDRKRDVVQICKPNALFSTLS